jgi:hypothetical protein
VFEKFISGVKIEGVQVEYAGLFQVLDGTDQRDYVQRVEPSERGGEKMAQLFINKLFG